MSNVESPAKRSNAKTVILGITIAFFGSCAGLIAYAQYDMSTPEYQQQLKARNEHFTTDKATLLARLARLPSDTTGVAAACPAGLSVAVVDDAYIAALNGTAVPFAELARLSALRSKAFDDALFQDAVSGKAPSFGAAERMAEAAALSHIAVVRLDKASFTAPVVSGQQWDPGHLRASATVHDATTGTPLCTGTIEATSSDSVSTGGGPAIGIKVAGVKVGSVGSQGDLSEAVRKDFAEQLQQAATLTWTRLGVRLLP